MIAQTLHTMGTKLEFFVPGEVSFALWDEVRTEVLRLDRVFDRFNPESEVSVYNAGGRCTEALQDAFRLAECYRTLTAGLFDVNASGSADFGGFAKGYAMRRIRLILENAGVKDAFVSFGQSSIIALGSRPAEDGWKVNVTDPYSEQTLEECILRGNAMSVSGNSPSYSGHIINPLDGKACNEKALVTVVCPDPLDAEIISTAALIADTQQISVIERNFPQAEIKMYLL